MRSSHAGQEGVLGLGMHEWLVGGMSGHGQQVRQQLHAACAAGQQRSAAHGARPSAAERQARASGQPSAACAHVYANFKVWGRRATFRLAGSNRPLPRCARPCSSQVGHTRGCWQ